MSIIHFIGRRLFHHLLDSSIRPNPRISALNTLNATSLSSPLRYRRKTRVIRYLRSMGSGSVAWPYHFSDGARPIIEAWRSKRIKSELPSIAELNKIGDYPLLESEKIPISVDRMKALAYTPLALGDFCTDEDVKLLFRAGDIETP